MSGAKTCRFFLQGSCKFGPACRFLHSDDSGGQYYYQDEYESRNNRNAGQQSYGDTNRNYKHGERDDYRNTSSHNYKNDTRNTNEYEQNNSYYKNNNRSNVNNQYEQNNYQYDNRSNNQHAKKNYNRRNNYYEEQNNYYEGENDYYEENYEEENDNYNKNYNHNVGNKHRNNKSQTNYSGNNFKENNRKNNSKPQYYNNNYKNKNEDYNYQPKYEKNSDSFKNDNRNQTTSNKSKNFSNDQYSNNNYKTEEDNVSEKEKMKKLYKNEIKIYQMQMKQMLENDYWPFTCYNPIGQSPIVEPVGCLNLMEISFEELRCDYYGVKNICASPEMIHKQVYEELLLKAKKEKEDIVNLKDFALNDLIATFQKWEAAKLNSTFKNSIPVDKNIYWNMSLQRLNTPSDSKTLLDLFSFVMPDEHTTKDTGPKILMQTEVYGKMDNGFDQENFTDYVPIIPPPKKHCL